MATSAGSGRGGAPLDVPAQRQPAPRGPATVRSTPSPRRPHPATVAAGRRRLPASVPAGSARAAAVSFAASIPSSGVSSTGLFFNGDNSTTDQPRAPDVYQPLAGTRHQLRGGGRGPQRPGHLSRRTPLVQRHHAHGRRSPTRPPGSATFSRDYANVNLPATVGGSDTAFVGFGEGGTDGRTSTHCDHELDLLQRRPDVDRPLGRLRQQRRRDGATGVTKFNGTAGRRDDRGRPAGGKPFQPTAPSISRTSRRRSTSRFIRRQGPTSPGRRRSLSFIIQNDPGHAAGPDHG